MTRRWQVLAARPVAYEVIKAPHHLFSPQDDTLLGFGRGSGSRRFVVVDAVVLRHHGEAIRNWFARRGIEARIVAFAGGEENKSLHAWQALARQLEDFPLHRRDEPIIAIGGGVLTDVVAYLAASYRRGVPHIKVPTTLMGYVDAALGVKCGVNFEGSKNRLGAFEPPLAVLLDPGFLTTLPRRHLHNGTGEILKLAVISDGELFRALEAHGTTALATHFADADGDKLLDAAIDGMLAELAPNLFEADLARKVDFGHTFSYGLEAQHGDRLLHGEAVLLDVLVSTAIAQRRGLLAVAEGERVFALVARLGLSPDLALLDGDAMWAALQDRILHRNGRQRVPLPPRIGDCVFVDDIRRDELDLALAALHFRFKVGHELVTEC